MIYIYDIIVLVLACAIGYELGLKAGKKQSNGVCQECINDVFMEGYDQGSSDTLQHQELANVLSVAMAKNIDTTVESPKKAPKKVAKKATKKSK